MKLAHYFHRCSQSVRGVILLLALYIAGGAILYEVTPDKVVIIAGFIVGTLLFLVFFGVMIIVYDVSAKAPLTNKTACSISLGCAVAAAVITWALMLGQ